MWWAWVTAPAAVSWHQASHTRAAAASGRHANGNTSHLCLQHLPTAQLLMLPSLSTQQLIRQEVLPVLLLRLLLAFERLGFPVLAHPL